MSQEDFVIHFPTALLGFPQLTSFRLMEPKGAYPIKFLQSTEDESVSFTCMDAAAVKLDYQVPLTPEEAETLALNAPEEALVLIIVVVPAGDPHAATANLAGPVVVNTRTRVGRQMHLDIERFPLKFPVFASKVEAILDFPAGLVGFPEMTRFRLFEHQGGYPFKFLQSVEDEDVAFTCMDVAAFKPDFEVPLSDEEASCLALENPADAMVLALVAIPKDPTQMTANLAGPVVINLKTGQARQIVLNIEQYPLKYSIFAGN